MTSSLIGVDPYPWAKHNQEREEHGIPPVETDLDMSPDLPLTCEELAERARVNYQEQFQVAPETLARAPGRLEILGNHTDYNNGYILSIALDLSVVVAAGRDEAVPRRVAAWSSAFNERIQASLEEPIPVAGSWINYPLGVLNEFIQVGVRLPSMNLAVESSLPTGAGVSSSAALELATAEAAYDLLGGRPDDLMEVARLCRRAENTFVGVPCGILDQFSTLFGKRDHVLFLDCKSLEYERVPLPESTISVVIADSRIRHKLVDGQYARLRSHCESAARQLSEVLERPVPSLREVTLEEFLDHQERIEEEDRRRAEHVVRENARVLAGIDALRGGNTGRLGELMLESHASSRDLFGNSCEELDFLVETAAQLPGFIGGKLSGGGFGGTTVNLVEEKESAEFQARLISEWNRRFGAPMRVFQAKIGDGAQLL